MRASKPDVNGVLKKLAGRALRGTFSLVRYLPAAQRRWIFTELASIESRSAPPASALPHLFGLLNDLNRSIDRTAIAYEGGGVHPKHRLTNYHAFFVERIPPGSRVLDVGCGIGAVAKSIALAVSNATVLGVDKEEASIRIAQEGALPSNLSFATIDVTDDLPAQHWDVIVLSNVLEHVDDRVGLLRELVRRGTPARLLVRVPLFERHWHMPLRRELGVDYFSDPTHEIEHTLAEFEAEVAAAGLAVIERQTLWGEIWAHLETRSRDR